MSWFTDTFFRVPAMDTQANLYTKDLIGNKTDTPVYYAGTTTTIMSYLKGLTQTNEYSTRCTIRAAANLPQSTTTAYFTVSGRVLVYAIVGEVTTVIENTGAVNIDLWSNPTVGADVALCAVADIANDAVGTLYTITGTLADAIIPTTSGAVKMQANPVLVTAGTIDLKTSASKTGQTKWTIHWRPLDSGATITAV
jgi:hypothetical protein